LIIDGLGKRKTSISIWGFGIKYSISSQDPGIRDSFLSNIVMGAKVLWKSGFWKNSMVEGITLENIF